MKAKKIIMLALIGLLAFYLITNPTQSANAVHTVWGWFQDVAQALYEFVKGLFN